MYCKHCLRALQQQPEKAVGDGEVQIVWANPDGNWVCPENGEEHEPVKDNPFNFTSINPHITAGNGQAYYFTFNGSDYYVEDWSTDNASGEDLYDADTERNVLHADIFESDEQIIAFDEALEEARDLWHELYAHHVDPAYDRAIAEYKRRLAPKVPPVQRVCHVDCVLGQADHPGYLEYRCMDEDGNTLPFPGEEAS